MLCSYRFSVDSCRNIRSSRWFSCFFFFVRILLAHNESSAYRTFVSCHAQAVAPTADRRSQWAQLLTATFPHNNVRLNFTILGTSTDFFCHEEGPDCYSKTTTEDSSSETCAKYKNVFRQDVQRHSTRIAALQKCVVYSNLTAVLFILSVSKVFEVTNIGHLKENVYTVVKFNIVTSRGRANVLEDIGWRSK